MPSIECGDLGPEINLNSLYVTISLSSTNYPNRYTNSLSCTWTVTAPYSYRVYLNFRAFSLEPNADYLTVTGTEESYPLVSYTGDQLPPDIESPSNYLFVMFETDRSVGYTGFLVSVSLTLPLGEYP